MRFVPGCSTTYLRSNDILTGTPIYSILSHGQTLAGTVTRQPYAMIIPNSKHVGVWGFGALTIRMSEAQDQDWHSISDQSVFQVRSKISAWPWRQCSNIWVVKQSIRQNAFTKYKFLKTISLQFYQKVSVSGYLLLNICDILSLK